MIVRQSLGLKVAGPLVQSSAYLLLLMCLNEVKINFWFLFFFDSMNGVATYF